MPDLIDTPALRLEWMRAPWDEAVCPYPVIQINHIEVRGPDARADMRTFEALCAAIGAGLVSCRLPHDRLGESMLLEECGFRFIEMLYAPLLELDRADITDAPGALKVALASDADMPTLLAIAGNAFHNERFRMDPRLDPSISDQRYRNWVASTPGHPRQQLFTISEAGRILSFFIVELQEDGTCYWHLNALAEDARGQGYGRRVWLAMMDHARRIGSLRIRTSVVARNVRVLSLYAKLGFSLPPPAMTFHWTRS